MHILHTKAEWDDLTARLAALEQKERELAQVDAVLDKFPAADGKAGRFHKLEAIADALAAAEKQLRNTEADHMAFVSDATERLRKAEERLEDLRHMERAESEGMRCA